MAPDLAFFKLNTVVLSLPCVCFHRYHFVNPYEEKYHLAYSIEDNID